MTRAFETLLPREERILRLHHGIGTDTLSLKEIGEQFGVTKERIRMIEARALQKIRDREYLMRKMRDLASGPSGLDEEVLKAL